MADNSKKVSELPTAANVAGTDRVMVLRSPASNASVRTITVTNFMNTFPKATSNSVGLVMVDNTTITVSNGTISTTQTSNTFNPNFSTNTGNTIAVLTQTGHYTTIGKLCFFRVYVDFASSTYQDGSGQYQISLPFPAVDTVTVRGGTLHNPNTAAIFHIGGITDIVTGNTSVLSLYYTGSTTDLAWKNTTPVGWFTGNNSHFNISGIYETV